MIDNFEAFKLLMQFDEGDFFFLQIIQRKKDNPNIERNMNLIDSFCLYSIEQLDHYRERIITKCQNYNARAYIHVNVRNAKKVALQTLKNVTDLIISEEYKAVKNAYFSACGTCSSQTPRRWIIDVDDWTPDSILGQQLVSIITDLQKVTNRYRILTTLPTKNGYHLITNPFDLQKFTVAFYGSNIEVKKDSPTLLYIP